MFIDIKGQKVNITPELQKLLRDNPPEKVKKPVISKNKTKEFVALQEVDENGIGKTIDAVYSVYPYVYFDEAGRYYLNVFRSTFVEHEGKDVEVLVTNPNIKTDPNCNLYARGEKSHNVPIPGSENWADGRPDNYVHNEALSKGKPEYLITLKLTRDEVLAIELKPQGNNIVGNIANLSDAEKETTLRQLLGNDMFEKLKEI